jgi:DNA polymerase III sliding clamp (beta) subunit (PCNA family)
MFKSVRVTTSSDVTNHILSNFYVESSGEKVLAVGLNGHAMSISNLDFPIKNFSSIVPHELIDAMDSIPESQEVLFNLSDAFLKVVYSNEDVTQIIISKILGPEGYPPFRRVIPSTKDLTFMKVSVSEMLSATRSVSLSSSAATSSIQLFVKDSEFVLSASDESNQQASTEVQFEKVDFGGGFKLNKDHKVDLSSKYLLGQIQRFAGQDFVFLGFTPDSMGPVVATLDPLKMSNLDTVVGVIMPMSA